jgi:hypothetical protein
VSAQGNFADQFAQAEPLKVKTPHEGFEHCTACHGSGVQYGPPQCCSDCSGMGQILSPSFAARALAAHGARKSREPIRARARELLRDMGKPVPRILR